MKALPRIVVALLLAGAVVAAQRILYLETLTVTSGAAIGFVTCIADVATNSIYVSVDVAPIRWRADGTAPTGAVGHLAPVGSSIVLNGRSNLVNFKAIAPSATATITGSCSRP